MVRLSVLLSLVAPAIAAAPALDNRPPKPDEWGYRPADRSKVVLNPPSLTWLLEAAAKSYTVQWSRDGAFRSPQTAGGVPWPTYTHHAPLEPGDYWWRYRFETSKGATSNWSEVRRFTVGRDAVEFPKPTLAELKERVPVGHPRLFLRPEDLPKIRQAARTTAAESFGELKKRADQYIAAGPTPEPAVKGSARDKDNPELIKNWWPNREKTEKACLEAETIAFVYLVSGEARYGEAARRWILHLAAWDPDGPTNFTLNCEAAKPLLYRPARAYDWAYAALSAEDREVFRKALGRRINDAWQSGEVQRGVGHLNRPYNSHGNRVWHKIAETAIALLGDLPEADVWLDYAVNKFYACYPVWSDDDGGWHEGLSYMSGYMGKAVWWLQVSRSALEIDGLRKPFFSQVGDFPLYIAPPNSPNMGFGDLAYRPPSATSVGFMEYFLRAAGGEGSAASRAGYWRWWTDRWKMRGDRGVLGFLYEVNLPPLPPARPPTDLPPSKVFHGIGVASLHTTLLDSADDVHLLFKSSPFGSQSHGHNPQNTFQLNAYAEPLLVTCVYRDLHGSRFHYNWVHSTVAHNGVLVDGEGQKKHATASQGRIVAEQFGGGFDYVAGDATAAYDGRLRRYVRHAVLVKGRSVPLVVLCDDLEAPQPSRFQFMLHALQEFAVDARRATVATQRPKAGVTVAYLGPGPLEFRQWDGFDPKPTREFPNQWHVEASTTQKAPRLAMLALIVPYRGDRPPEIEVKRVETAGAVGLEGRVGGQPLGLAFRKEGKAAAAATWDGKRFSGPVVVRP